MSGQGEADRTPRVGSRVGPYRLLSEIGAGGMGTVYLARVEAEDENLPAGQCVALKVIHAHLPTRPGFLVRFEREVEAGRRVRHPNVVPTHAMGAEEVDGQPSLYLSMDYVEGRTLRELLDELGRVPETLLRELARQIASGLTAIHAAGIVHRDLKPENVLVTDDHDVRISDLGVVQLLEESQELTGAGHFAGSILYAAPEQFRNEKAHPAADLYSLGVLMYELATGSNPFRHDAMMAAMRAHLEHTPPSLTEADLGISPFLAEVVSQLLAKDPSKRFRSAARLAEVLHGGEESEWWGEKERELRRIERRRPRLPVRRDTRLHGRRDALDLLRDAWEEAVQGRGGAVLVVGEAGIGKTRVADAFLEKIRAQDAHVLYGSYAPAAGAGGVSEALRDHFGAAHLSEAITGYLSGTPALASALAATTLGRPSREGSTHLPLDAVKAALVELVRAMAAEQPVVWIVDDLDRAPVESQQVVLALARGIGAHRVLLLVTSTPDLSTEAKTSLAGLERLRRIELGRLSPREVVELLRDAFRSEVLAERLGVKVAYKSDGVPFFVFEVIRGLEDGQFIERQSDGTFTQSRVVEEIEIPSLVRDLVRARLRDVSKEERAILDVAAAQGFEFDADLVAAVLERKRVAVLQDLADLERRLGLVCAIGRRYRFDHHQIADVIYEDLAPALRAAYHSMLANAYAERRGLLDAPGNVDGTDATILANHHLKGSSPVDAGPYVARALEELVGTYRHEAAVAMGREALAVPGLLADRSRVETALLAASQLEIIGRWSEELELLEETLGVAEGLGDGPLSGGCHARIGRHHARKAQWDQALLAYDQALQHAVQDGDAAAECRAECGRGEVLASTSRYDEAAARYTRALALARASSDTSGEWSATSGLAQVARRRGQGELAAQGFREALTLAESLGDVRSITSSSNALGNALVFLGRYDEAQTLHERGLEQLHEIGDRIGEAYLLGSLGIVHLRKGRFEEACACQQRVIDIAREVGDPRAESTGIANQGLAYLHMDRLQDARRRFEQYRGICRKLSSRGGEAWSLARLGDVDLKSDDPRRAHDHFRDALALARRVDNRWAQGLAIGNLGMALLGMGRLGEAEHRIRESLAISRELGDRQGEGAAESDLGTLYLNLGYLDRADEHFASCLAISESIGDRRGEAYSREGLGRTLLARGRYDEARTQLRTARDVAEAIGGRRRDAWIALALQELAVREDHLPRAGGLARQAVAIGREVCSPSLVTLGLCRLSLLPDGDAEAAENAYEEHGERLPLVHRMESAILLWSARADRARLEDARASLERLALEAPAEQAIVFDAVPLYRKIREA